MKISKLKEFIKELPDNAEILISSDEELNTMYRHGEVSKLINTDKHKDTYVIYGYSGTEVEL